MLLVCILFVLILSLKLLIPPNPLLWREVCVFLGLERETVQAIGRSLDDQARWQSAWTADP